MLNDILTEQIYKAYCENYTSFKINIKLRLDKNPHKKFYKT